MASKEKRNYIRRSLTEVVKDAHTDEFTASYIPRFTTPEEFINAKIELLQGELCIHLTYEDKQYLRQFKTEGEINAAVKAIINKYWE